MKKYIIIVTLLMVVTLSIFTYRQSQFEVVIVDIYPELNSSFGASPLEIINPDVIGPDSILLDNEIDSIEEFNDVCLDYVIDNTSFLTQSISNKVYTYFDIQLNNYYCSYFGPTSGLEFLGILENDGNIFYVVHNK